MILLTGGSGFVGRNLQSYLKKNGVQYACLKERLVYGGQYTIPDNTKCVVHLAGIASEKNACSSELVFQLNTKETLNLAMQACRSGVSRFVFISTIKVNGEFSETNDPITVFSSRCPLGSYAESKAKAEMELLDFSKKSGMEIVIIRPPLVYGPNVKSNFLSLMRLVNLGIPLPFGSLDNNSRSLVYVDNLVDLILTCIHHPNAANQIFLVSDGQDISTLGMIEEMSMALGKNCRKLPVPVWLYEMVGRLFGKTETIERLVGSLQVDISHTKDTLSWKPSVTLREGFTRTAEAFLKLKG